MTRVVIAIFFFLFSADVSAFISRPEQNAFIVQFSKPVSKSLIAEAGADRFTEISSLNTEGTMFRIRYNPAITETYKVIELIRNIPYYQLHQDDCRIDFRATTPNDSLYSKQWHLPVIKAAEAWDLTRKGTTRNGDTIVIAVIDDGLHINHPDFGGNIWINYADTAGNGIDDDSNGYIDDHYGWNFMGLNNDISDSDYYRAGHGTPVAGIIGARGNNITGVTGIMWHVKLMIVNITDTGIFPQVFQSDVIKAYQYVLHQRKLYNSSNGTKGAYVVATNASWGADGRFPHQAPLWCSMYDTLGKYGILNVSAVTNDPQSQVDTDGDLPTLCSSPHLITVASTSSDDNWFSSGYSSISVDLSAPGANIFSAAAYTQININSNRIFRNGFSGTSYATPMVTAAIGVLQSYACERILDTLRINPAKGNAILRKCILEGVDQVDALAGKSVTGGRLNIKKALEIMNQYCLGYVGVNTPDNFPDIVLFPNPGNGMPELICDMEILNVSCYDLSGKQYICALDGKVIDVTALSAGVYVFRVETANGVYTLRYLKTE